MKSVDVEMLKKNSKKTFCSRSPKCRIHNTASVLADFDGFHFEYGSWFRYESYARRWFALLAVHLALSSVKVFAEKCSGCVNVLVEDLPSGFRDCPRLFAVHPLPVLVNEAMLAG